MKQDPTKIKYFVYPRKSSEQEDRQVASIDSQKNELAELTKRDQLKIVAVIEESHSAKYPGRPIFNKMVERIEKGEANGLLVWNASRISRNSVDTGKIIYLFDIGKLLEVRTPSQTFRNTPNDKFLLNLFCSQAKLENDTKGEDVKRGLRAKCEMGIYPAPAPTGYVNDKYAERGNKTILPDPDRFDVCRKMFDLMLTGNYTAQDVRRVADKEWGFKMTNGKPMSRNNIYSMFTNPVFYGKFEYPKRSGKWYKGIHKPMITEEEYDKIQFLLGRKGKPRPQKHVFDFTGIGLRCGECGGTIVATEKWKHQKNGNIHHYVYYYCSKRVNPNCKQGSVELKELNKQINETIVNFIIPSSVHTFMMKWFNKEYNNEAKNRNAVLESQQRSYKECLDNIDGLIDMRARKLINDDIFRTKLTPLEKTKARMEELMGDTGKRADSWIEIAKDFCTFVEYALEKFNTGDLQKRKSIFRALGQNLAIKDRKLDIDLENSLIPMETVKKEADAIHKRLEPMKNRIKQSELEQFYSKSPRMLPG